MGNQNGNNYNFARIKVIGVGGAGGNVISRMQEEFVKGVGFIAVNTDVQDLNYCRARRKIYIGKNLTRGLGTGMNPDVGRQAAEENRSELVEALKDSDLVFVTAGLGGGTGSGASPIIAEAAKESGALTVAIVTKPFAFEGSQRSRIAQEALLKLREKVDTLIVVPNDRIFSVIQKDTPLIKAFEVVDDVLRSAVQGIAELIAMPGIINVDFADVKTIMHEAGSAMIGIGIGSGQDRAMNAVTQAVNSPLLEISMEGARGVLFGISGGRDMKMNEINDIAKIIAEAADSSAKIIFGAYQDRKLKKGQLKVTLVATGFNGHAAVKSPETAISTLFNGGYNNNLMDKSSAKTAVNNQNGGAQDAKKDNEKPSAIIKKEKEDDIWNIPTFLRRKKRQ
ncbi:MAG: cell division protein FtsZ [Candidatus Harrisonbacteria bacterium RIFCSPHIGHO2_01_FULL_44_13]|uniref:Cell division protein FtsZ n=1 Tax=Candidatus Harrisonbacteria bacterium RIFCSPLOWO2_01_FULL_44_18 TaxID=1798407 RepID=A0A1G1ZRG7_9BACT|nr:MAG: cell division protein FtsZ [Candidatus Harrisonbacteria bacterium RIFCSPHIGHO2_01_FULL_44_13]OGY66350.1 MAG: cell division protein FtsZ [Candidatus Harrisonbacteria bacterium RIFCSPLOWO2_01_FULL_44_18]